jgi:hypothetical protein
MGKYESRPGEGVLLPYLLNLADHEKPKRLNLKGYY